MHKADAARVSKMVKALAAGCGDEAKVTKRDLLTYCFGHKKLATILLAIVGQQPVGFAITREWINFYIGIKLRHVDFIFVDKRYRQAGVGSALMQAVAKDAVKAKCQRLSLDVGLENEGAARLYKKLGFVKRTDIAVHYRLSDSGLMRLARRKD